MHFGTVKDSGNSPDNNKILLSTIVTATKHSYFFSERFLKNKLKERKVGGILC